MICTSSRQEQLNCESIVTLENQLGDAESREPHNAAEQELIADK
jgi:hypothetical protein